MGNRVASEVWASHPEMRNATRLPGTVSPIQEVSAIERSQVSVMEPALILGASARDMVSESDMAAQRPGGVRADQDPTLIFFRPGAQWNLKNCRHVRRNWLLKRKHVIIVMIILMMIIFVCRPVSTLKADILNITYDCYSQSQNNCVKMATL